MAREVGVGIDVSKDTLEVAIDGERETRRYGNTVEGLEAVLEALQGVAVCRVVLEASGGYERLALAALHAGGLPVVLVEPARARHFARGLGRRADRRIDATVLARMATVAVDDGSVSNIVYNGCGSRARLYPRGHRAQAQEHRIVRF